MRHLIAFTLIELLVVISIILVLAALLVPAFSMVRFAAQASSTSNRMENVLHALSTYGSGEQTSAYRLHAKLIAPRLLTLGGKTGVIDFVTSRRLSVTVPDPDLKVNGIAQDWLYRDVDASTPSYLFRWPWGQPALSYSDPTTGVTAGPAEPRKLAGLDPGLSFELLLTAGVFEAAAGDPAAAYASDRRRSAAWNDAWGNPLVVAWGMYQPQMNTKVLAQRVVASQSTSGNERQYAPPDWYYQLGSSHYKHTRSVYLVVAAAGPVLRTPLTGTIATDSAGIWNQVTQVDVTPGDGAGNGAFHRAGIDWDQDSFGHPPWKGVGRADATITGERERCFLTQPVDVR